MHSLTARAPRVSVAVMRKVAQRPAWHLYGAAHKGMNDHISHQSRLSYEKPFRSLCWWIISCNKQLCITKRRPRLLGLPHLLRLQLPHDDVLRRQRVRTPKNLLDTRVQQHNLSCTWIDQTLSEDHPWIYLESFQFGHPAQRKCGSRENYGQIHSFPADAPWSSPWMAVLLRKVEQRRKISQRPARELNMGGRKNQKDHIFHESCST